jgi:hypothetical protein
MKIVPIFGECLYATKYDGETKNEFRRLFDLWNDPEYLEDFFNLHEKDLNSGFWKTSGVFDAMFKTFEYASELEEQLVRLSERGKNEHLPGLETIFKPLHNSQSSVYTLNLSKAKATWLRVYALRVEKDIYIITGGAIKLTLMMEARTHTREELKKMNMCRDYLVSQGIVDREGLIDELEI